MWMIQEARPWLADFHTSAAFGSFPVFGDLSFSPWVVPGSLRVLGSEVFFLGCPWCLCVLKCSSFSWNC